VLTGRQCATATGEVMAGSAVEAEEIATAGNGERVDLTGEVGSTEFLHGQGAILVVEEAGATTMGGGGGGDGVGLGLSGTRGQTGRLRFGALHGHTAGVHLEVHCAFGDTDE